MLQDSGGLELPETDALRVCSLGFLTLARAHVLVALFRGTVLHANSCLACGISEPHAGWDLVEGIYTGFHGCLGEGYLAGPPTL